MAWTPRPSTDEMIDKIFQDNDLTEEGCYALAQEALYQAIIKRTQRRATVSDNTKGDHNTRIRRALRQSDKDKEIDEVIDHIGRVAEDKLDDQWHDDCCAS